LSAAYLTFSMKPISFIFILVLLYAAGCKCDDLICPTLTQESLDWLPYQPGETIRYVNNNGAEILFKVERFESGPSLILECGPDGLLGCKCPDCPEPNADAFARTKDTSRKITTAQGQTVMVFDGLYTHILKPDNKKDSVFLTYHVFDHRNTIAISPSIRLNSKDSLIAAFTVGNTTYANVIVHETDTTAKPYANPIYNVYFVWKSYYNKQYGVIAFHDLKTGSLFYRQP
jgi:hypothetical protein